MARKRDSQTDNLFKKDIPRMPEGYYSGDKPNPNLRAFVEQHIKERPYDPENDDYDVPAFDKPIETTKATAIYNMHTYWSKKPHDAIRQYIRHYTKPGDLVLDPFCGSGGTALAALMEGRKAIAIDRSPAATFITKNYCTPVDVEELQEAFEELKRKVKPEIDWLYETRCDRCGGKATTAYTVYSQVFQCPRCLEKVSLFDCVETEGRTAKGRPKKISACPHCYKRNIVEEINTRSEKFGAVPVLVSYICEKGCKPKRAQRRHNDSDSTKREYFERYDLGHIREIEAKEIPYWHPDIDFPRNFARWNSDLRLSGIGTVADLYTKRNCWALAIVRSKLLELVSPISDVAGSAIWTAITTVALTGTRMLRETKRAIQAGTYYIPPISREIKIAHGVEYNVSQLFKAQEELGSSLPGPLRLCISTKSAHNISEIPSATLDYIFTDPPYAENVQYGELNFVWEAWLGFDIAWHAEEIVVNEVRGKTVEDWADMMRQAMGECYRVLKPGRWLSLCYHDTSEGTWALIQDIMAEVGFLVDRSNVALFIDAEQKSYNQIVADKVNKRDLVINFRKPRPGEVTAALAITGYEDKATFSEKVRQIIREYLGAHPGASKDRIYDEVVSSMVRSGRMEAHDFDELLGQVAEEVKTPVMKDLFQNEDPNLFGTHEVGRWYLKETELAVSDAAETAKEDAAAEKIGTFIKEYIEKHPGEEGVHYSDLFEHYVYSVKEKPRRQLAEFLPDRPARTWCRHP